MQAQRCKKAARFTINLVAKIHDHPALLATTIASNKAFLTKFLDGAVTGRSYGFESICFRCLVLFVGLRLFCGWAEAQSGSTLALKKLSIEELINLEVTSVSKIAQPLREAAAAIYVITHGDIIRSGASSIPELIRLAPNLQVA